MKARDIASKLSIVFLIIGGFFAVVGIGQAIEKGAPESTIPDFVFFISMGLAVLLGMLVCIYDAGFEAAVKDQEPDEDNSRDSIT